MGTHFDTLVVAEWDTWRESEVSSSKEVASHLIINSKPLTAGPNATHCWSCGLQKERDRVSK